MEWQSINGLWVPLTCNVVSYRHCMSCLLIVLSHGTSINMKQYMKTSSSLPVTYFLVRSAILSFPLDVYTRTSALFLGKAFFCSSVPAILGKESRLLLPSYFPSRFEQPPFRSRTQAYMQKAHHTSFTPLAWHDGRQSPQESKTRVQQYAA